MQVNEIIAPGNRKILMDGVFLCCGSIKIHFPVGRLEVNFIIQGSIEFPLSHKQVISWFSG